MKIGHDNAVGEYGRPEPMDYIVDEEQYALERRKITCAVSQATNWTLAIKPRITDHVSKVYIADNFFLLFQLVFTAYINGCCISRGVRATLNEALTLHKNVVIDATDTSEPSRIKELWKGRFGSLCKTTINDDGIKVIYKRHGSDLCYIKLVFLAGITASQTSSFSQFWRAFSR